MRAGGAQFTAEYLSRRSIAKTERLARQALFRALAVPPLRKTLFDTYQRPFWA
jgi:hypothetical protein